MSRKTEPVIKTDKNNSFEDYEETHPAFGQVSFHRVQGNPGKLYGSSTDSHLSFVTLKVRTSKLFHHLGRDWHFAKDDIVKVDLSSAQFAELLTSMNVGSGVPCTVRYVTPDGPGEVSNIPEDEVTENTRIEESFKRSLKKCVQKLQENEKKVKEILEKKSIGKKDKEALRDLIYESYRFFVDSAPFLVKQFQEATEKTVVTAKAEVDAFMTGAIQKADLEALQEQSKLLKE